MNETPETVNELLDMQQGTEEDTDTSSTLTKKQQKHLDKLVSKALDRSPAVGLELTKVLLEKLANYHKAAVTDQAEEGAELVTMGQWVLDLGHIQSAMACLESVTLTIADED